MALVLGMCLAHDGAVAVVVDGQLRAAIARERLTRVKKEAGVTLDMIAYVLDRVGASLREVDTVAFGGFQYVPGNPIRLFSPDGFQEQLTDLYDVPLRQQLAECRMQVGGVTLPAVFVHHHLSHCASAYYTSRFDQAACFSLDASMFRPEACSLFAYGQGRKLYPLFCPGLMIGNAYHIVTEQLGLGLGLFKAGSTMGLAAYGTPSDLARQKWRDYGRSWYERPFMPDDLTFIQMMWSELSGLPPHAALPPAQSDGPAARGIAASIQYVFEETIVTAAQRLHAHTAAYNGNNVCLSGGSFLNCNVNTRVQQETPFEHVHLFPGCGDDGTAVGAALYVAHNLLDEPRCRYRPRELAYLGRPYATPDVGEPLDLPRIARLLADGGLVAWYQGGGEFGPRALGNRSLLADPRRPGMRDFINSQVKRREWFRPLAPSVLEDSAADWFDFAGPSPYMLHTSRVKRPAAIPAVTHVDGSARQQTVHRDDNPRYYDLIAEFDRLTGVPLVLNTSLNVNSEPLVETPQDALRFYEATGVHALVIDERMVLNPRPKTADLPLAAEG